VTSVETDFASATGRMGRPIRGPSAVGDDFGRMLRLALTLAVTDFKLRFFGSILGYLWTLMRPLALFGVLYTVFALVLNVDSSEERFYPVALLLGLVLYTFLAESTVASVRALILRESLVRKVDFPRMAVPLSCVLLATFNLAINLVVVAVFLVASGGDIRLTWLELPLIISLLVMFALGLSMLLSALFVRFRDIEPIWDVVMQAMFYATPIFFTFAIVSREAGEKVAHLMWITPMAAIVQQSRHAFVDPSHVNAWDALSSPAMIAIPIAITVAVFVVGLWYFSKRAPLVAEEL
jgi:ABC-2 type transport system permease protein